MQKLYSHNQKTDTKVFSKGQQVSKKQTVDINKLLNRVKINQKNEKKKKSFIVALQYWGFPC